MQFPWSRKPYVVRVQKVTDDSIDVSGATIKLENLTKATETSKTSSKTNSNIAIPLANCGDFDIGDEIKATATSDGKTGSSTHTTASGDHGVWNAGEIAITSEFVPRVRFF